MLQTQLERCDRQPNLQYVASLSDVQTAQGVVMEAMYDMTGGFYNSGMATGHYLHPYLEGPMYNCLGMEVYACMYNFSSAIELVNLATVFDE